MTDSMGEHHAHHQSSKDGFAMYVLPLSILLAAVIVGYAMMSSATTVGVALSKVTITTGAGSGGNNLPTANPGNGDLQQPPTKTIAELSEGAPGKIGSDTAPLVMIEYSDYQCPFCKNFYKNTELQLIQKFVDAGQLQILYKDFPLPFHPMAAPSANAARCAGDQGKYWEMHDKIFEETYAIDPAATSQYTLADLKAWGAELGLNTATFNACVDNDTHASEVQANYTEGSSAGVSGTPSFFLGPRDGTAQLIVGAQPLAQFEAAIEAELANLD